MSAPHPAPTGIVTTMLAPPCNFDVFFTDPERDLYTGDNASVYRNVFTPIIGTAWDEARIHCQVCAMSTDVSNAYIRLFEDPTHSARRTCLLHTSTGYPSVMGHTTLYDGQAYAFLDDVTSGLITTVNFPINYFELAGTGPLRVHDNPATLHTAFTNDVALELLAPVAAGAGTTTMMMPRLMYVPPYYALHLLGKQYTLRKLIMEFV